MHERNSKEASSSSKIDWNQEKDGDLLSRLRQAAGRHEEKKQDEELWNPKSTYSISDISANNRIANKKKTCGWILVDGQKTYTTYRNGGIVRGQGAEAFKLSMGDTAPITKKRNNESKENRSSKKSTSSTSRNREEVFEKPKVCRYENLPGNGDFDFSFS